MKPIIVIVGDLSTQNSIDLFLLLKMLLEPLTMV